MTFLTFKTTFLIAACALSISATAKNNPKKQTAKAAPAPHYAESAEAMRFADDLAERRGLDREWVRQAIGQARLLREVMLAALDSDTAIRRAVRLDLQAVEDRDSACHEIYIPFLYFKGFHALQTYRVAHWLWKAGRQSLALFFQNRMSTEFGVDIHPAARLGHGIMLDHATGLVIGETAVVGNNVSMLQSVTLGGTGKDEGDRHPKIGDGVLISAGAKILGNIRVGDGAKVGAGSVVLEDVPAHTTVAGVPARVVGRPASAQPALEMDHHFCCDEATVQQEDLKTR